jgi:hypothetical protein
MSQKIILFGGGDGGGLIITEHGIHPIPPFDPGILLNLRAANDMLRASLAVRQDKMRTKVSKSASSLCNLAIEQIEEVLGPLEGNPALIYQDDDGGFSCGSTGKPPIPFPWPVLSIPSVHTYVSAGIVEADLVAVVRAAHAKKIPLTRVFASPEEVAKDLGLTLSAKSAADLRGLAPDKLKAIKNPIEREVVGFFQKVVEDGRFVENWFSRPYEVSKSLEYKLSEAASELILTGSAGRVGGPVSDDAGSYAIAAGIWVGVCIAVGTATHQYGDYARPIETFVIDRSKRAKI